MSRRLPTTDTLGRGIRSLDAGVRTACDCRHQLGARPLGLRRRCRSNRFGGDGRCLARGGLASAKRASALSEQPWPRPSFPFPRPLSPATGATQGQAMSLADDLVTADAAQSSASGWRWAFGPHLLRRSMRSSVQLIICRCSIRVARRLPARGDYPVTTRLLLGPIATVKPTCKASLGWPFDPYIKEVRRFFKVRCNRRAPRSPRCSIWSSVTVALAAKGNRSWCSLRRFHRPGLI